MRALLLFLVTSLVVQSGCSDGGQIAGNTSSETTNGIVAQAKRANGSYAADASVRLRQKDYLANPSGEGGSGDGRLETITDSQGRFSLTGIEPGEYRIEVADTAVRQALVIDCSFEPKSGMLNLGTDTLKPFTTLTGSVTIDTAGPAVQRYVRVYGLERLVPVDSNGIYRIDDLPAGTHRIQLIRSVDTVAIPVAVDSVTAAPGDTITAPLVDPLRTLAVRLNTTTAGADVAEDVPDFPLLIRLPLGGAAAGDSLPAQGDTLVLVSTADGTPLPFEIEQWDWLSGEAAIWVRVDTVYGNSDTQQLFLRWAPVNQFVQQHASAVFDTAGGHFAVWHLSELPGGGVLHDATDNRYHAKPHKIVTDTASVPGIAGRALYNSGRWDFITTDTLRRTPGEQFTLSVWVQPDTSFAAMDSAPVGFIEQQQRGIGGYHFGALPPGSDSIGLRLYTGLQSPRFTSASYVETNWSDGWYHLSAVFDSGEVRLYHNGELRIATQLSGQWSIDAGTDPIMLGTWLRGAMDEARIYHRAQSAAYVKLCYATQKPEQNTVVFQ